MPLLLAAAVALGVSLLAARLGALSFGGAALAAAVGTAVLAGTGFSGGLVLAAFFVPASWISRWSERHVPSWVDARGNQRDAVQVAANGMAASLGGVLALREPVLGLWIVSGAFAVAAADTWATAIGMWSRRDPRLITTARPVAKGTSGAVSLTGTLGSLAGAGLVAAMAAVVSSSLRLGIWTLAVGLAGMVVDSVLGATLQGKYRCPVCETPSERTRHRCGAATQRTGGLRWLTNDSVNALATAAGAVAGAAGWCWLG